jgi:hypothetical protein
VCVICGVPSTSLLHHLTHICFILQLKVHRSQVLHAFWSLLAKPLFVSLPPLPLCYNRLICSHSHCTSHRGQELGAHQGSSPTLSHLDLLHFSLLFPSRLSAMYNCVRGLLLLGAIFKSTIPDKSDIEQRKLKQCIFPLVLALVQSGLTQLIIAHY